MRFVIRLRRVANATDSIPHIGTQFVFMNIRWGMIIEIVFLLFIKAVRIRLVHLYI